MALVVPANAAGVPTPAAPNNPPTVQDVDDAHTYHQQLRHSYDSGSANSATLPEVVAARQYDLAVLQTLAGTAVAPPWFAPVQAQLNAIQAQGEETERRLRITENRTRGNGTESPFLELKFLPNAPQHAGLYPTAIPTPNTLPLLDNITAIANLTDAQTNAYCDGYQIGLGLGNWEKKILICKHIGCTQTSHLASMLEGKALDDLGSLLVDGTEGQRSQGRIQALQYLQEFL